MICEIHNRFFPTKQCQFCEEERIELEHAIRMAEIENRQPIIIWENKYQ